MDVSLNIAQPAGMTVGDSMVVNSQATFQKNGLFELILAGVPNPENETQSACLDGKNTDFPKAEASAGGDVQEAGDKGIQVLMLEQLLPENGNKLTGKSLGEMNRVLNRLLQAIKGIPTEGKTLISESQLGEIRSAAVEMKQVVAEAAGQAKSNPPEEENQGKEGVPEEPLKRLSEKLDELTGLVSALLNPLPGNVEPDPGKMEIADDSGNVSEESGKLGQIISSIRSSIEQCKDLSNQKQTDLKPEAGEIYRNNRISEFPAGKVTEQPARKELYDSQDESSNVKVPPVVSTHGDAKLFSIRTSETVKSGQSPISFPPRVEAGNTGSAGNIPAFPNVEAVSPDSSSSGEFSKTNEEALRNPADGGKVNIAPTNSNLNMGMRSFDVTVQSLEESQKSVSEPSKPVSHEQIMTQVREKLSAIPSGADINRITLKLHPEELGELRISIKMENQNLKVNIITENQNVKDALMQNMDSLKETLSRQNISMETFNVLTGGGHGNGDNYREWRQTALNAVPYPASRSYGFTDEEPSERNTAYLDSPDNSLIDVRL